MLAVVNLVLQLSNGRSGVFGGLFEFWTAKHFSDNFRWLKKCFIIPIYLLSDHFVYILVGNSSIDYFVTYLNGSY